MAKITSIGGFNDNGCAAVIPRTPYQSGLLQIRYYIFGMYYKEKKRQGALEGCSLPRGTTLR